MLIPNEKRAAVQALLDDNQVPPVIISEAEHDELLDKPWKGLLGDSE